MKRPSPRQAIAAATATAVLLLSSACGLTDDDAAAAAGSATVSTVAATTVTTPAETHADADDGDYDAADATSVTLADGATSVDGAGVEVDGDTVTITAAGTYLLSGSLSDGQVIVDSTGDGTVRLVLDGVDVTSTTSSPIVVTAADEAVLVLADGTTSTLSDGPDSGSDDEEEDAPNATVFSMADLTIAGTGTLRVDGASNDGITSKDGLVILSGTVDVTAVDDGIRGKDYLVVEGGTVSVEAGGDGLKADNDNEGEEGWIQVDDGDVTVRAGSDGADAVGALNVTGGTVTVTDSEEGLEAATITLAGGTVDLTATDDGLNATAGSGDETTGGGMGGMGEQAQEGVLLTISGGEVHVTAGGDGLDSNGSAIITDGTTIIDGPTTGGNGALDVNGSFAVDGGTLVAVGTADMAVAPDADSEQGWVAATLDSTVAAGQQIVVAEADGAVVARYTVPQETAFVVVSNEAITTGEEYVVLAGDAGNAEGYSTDGSTDGLEQVATATAGEFEGGGFGGGGGGFGGDRPDGEGPDGGRPDGPPEGMNQPPTDQAADS